MLRACHLYRLLCILIAALVGFEFPSYTVKESDARVEICVVVSNPTVDELLAFNIITVHVTRSGTAGEDYCKINLEIGAIIKLFIFTESGIDYTNHCRGISPGCVYSRDINPQGLFSSHHSR